MTESIVTVLGDQDPGALPEELVDVPGFVNELAAYTLASAHSPNRTLAALGAIAMLAHLAGRSHVDAHGTRTNIDLFALGSTGIGKDAPRRTNRRLADCIGASDAVCDQFASGEALEEGLARRAALLFQPDEVETFVGALSGAGRNACGLSERVRRLYSASASFYAVRGTARIPEGTLIPYPHLTIFGTGTPEAFYDALGAKAVSNGLFGRCLVVNVKDDGRVNLPTDLPPPAKLVETAQYFVDREKAVTAADALDLVVADETDEAKALLLASAQETRALRTRLDAQNRPVASALVARMSEKIAKLALIRALSAAPENPRITAEAVTWATKFTVHITKGMLNEAQFHIAEGKFDSLMKRFLRNLQKHGGSMERREIIKNLHIDCQTFTRLVRTLQMRDEVLEETECGKNPIYTLKTKG